MRQSQLFYKTQKTLPKGEVSKNAQLLLQAGYIDRLTAGVYSILPLGQRVLAKIEEIIREEMNGVGGQELFLPALHPKENWEKTGRWDELDVLFKFEASEKKYALGPTHEEVLVPLAKKIISSHKDLPKYVYQFQDKFRNELRAKSGILRTREFVMKDFYSFHKDEDDLDEYYEKMKTAYSRVYEKCGIGDITYLTYASGGTFSKYSHEYQTITEAGEDLIYICDKCGVAVNKEIIEEQKHACPECQNEDLREEKAVEVGNIFKIKDKFSKPFKLVYKNEKGEDKNVIMGCYGIGMQRLMGTIVEAKNDDKGIIWPKEVAPFDVHLLSFSQNEEAEKVYQFLNEQGFDVLYDDRDANPGEKMAESDILGVPVRLIVSGKTVEQDKISLKLRDAEEEKMVSKEELLELLKK